MTRRQIERTVSAFAPLGPPPKELDVYQKHFKDQYINAFGNAWKAELDAFTGTAAALKGFKKKKGGKERRFASTALENESEEIKAKLAEKCKELRDAQIATHVKFWASPYDALPDSRLW